MRDHRAAGRGNGMSALQGMTLLLVEDEPIVAMRAEDMLLELGAATVELCYRVDPAIAAIGQQGFDAAVLDINLNGERSFPIAAILTERAIPFIFATGFADRETPFPGAPVIGKPYRTQELAQALGRALDRRANEAAS